MSIFLVVLHITLIAVFIKSVLCVSSFSYSNPNLPPKYGGIIPHFTEGVTQPQDSCKMSHS